MWARKGHLQAEYSLSEKKDRRPPHGEACRWEGLGTEVSQHITTGTRGAVRRRRQDTGLQDLLSRFPEYFGHVNGSISIRAWLNSA